MANSLDPQNPRRARGGRPWHPLSILARGVWTFLLALGALGVMLGWWLSQQPRDLGPHFRDLAVAALDTRLAPLGIALDASGLSLHLRPGLVPSLRGENLRLSAPNGAEIGVDRLDLVIDRDRLLAGTVAPRAVTLSGLSIDVTRGATGDVTLRLGEAALLEGIESPGALVAQVSSWFDRPPLSALRSVGASDVAISLRDLETGAVVESPAADLRIDHDAGRIALRASMGEIGGAQAPGSARMDLVAGPGGDTASLRVALRGIVPSELPGRALLGAGAEIADRLQVPLSVDLEGDLAADGGLGTMRGTVSAGSGVLVLGDPAAPVALTAARAAIETRDGGRRFDLTDLRISTDVLTLNGRGHLFASEGRDVLSAPSLIAQLDLRDVRIAEADRLPAPVHVDALGADLRLVLAADSLDLDGTAELSLGDDTLAVALRSTGSAGLNVADRHLALDVRSAQLDRARVFALWPVDLFPRTRQWLDENVLRGTLQDVAFALRHAPDPEGTEAAMSFGFRDADIRFLGSVAPLQDASGRATLERKTFRLQIDTGQIAPEGAEIVQVRPSVMTIPDVTRRPGLLQLDMGLDAPTAALLTVLGRPPFKRDPDARMLLAPQDVVGRTALAADIEVPLGTGQGVAAARFTIDGTVAAFSNDTLLQGRRLSADRIDLMATEETLTLQGSAQVEGQPLTIRFSRDFDRAPSGATPPRISAEGPLTPALAAVFGVNAPDGARIDGAGRLKADIAFRTEGPADLAISADLAGLGLSVPQAGIAKSARAGGSLELAGRLSQPLALERVAITIPGLTARGRVNLAGAGGLGSVAFDRLDLGGWLRARGSFRPARGTSAARLQIDGGQIDLRDRPRLSRSSTATRAPDIAARLSSVTISDTLRLTDVEARMPGSVGSRGRLTASVNGLERFTADLVRQRAGIAGTLRSGNAGRLLAAAGLFSNARGGDLELRVVPGDAPGVYEGQLRVSDAALHGAGAAAEIVSALSIVGAFDQIAGEGIVFTEIGARFRLMPDRLILQSAFAEGPALGLSLDGTVDLRSRRLALQGAVSPIHFLNRAGGPRRGEGLLGAAFRVDGTTQDPQVQILPLSLLAPGIMRDMFRRPEGAAE